MNQSDYQEKEDPPPTTSHSRTAGTVGLVGNTNTRRKTDKSDGQVTQDQQDAEIKSRHRKPQVAEAFVFRSKTTSASSEAKEVEEQNNVDQKNEPELMPDNFIPKHQSRGPSDKLEDREVKLKAKGNGEDSENAPIMREKITSFASIARTENSRPSSRDKVSLKDDQKYNQNGNDESVQSDFLEEKLKIAQRSTGRRGDPLPEWAQRRLGDQRGNDSINGENEAGSAETYDIDLQQEESHHANPTYQPGAFAVGPRESSTDALKTTKDAWDSRYSLEIKPSDNMLGYPVPPEGRDTTHAENQAGKESMDPVAVVVDKDELKRELMQDAAQAQIVEDDESQEIIKRYIVLAVCLILIVILVVGLSVGLTVGRDSKEFNYPSETPSVVVSEVPSISPTVTPPPTLETIAANGVIRCAVGILPWGTELCRALAAATLGNASSFEVVASPVGPETFKVLANRTADVSTLTPLRMERDVFQGAAKTGFSFSIPYFHDGVAFGGVPEYLDCADKLDAYFGFCKGVRICVPEGSSFADVVVEWFSTSKIKFVQQDALYQNFIDGECNVLVGVRFGISQLKLRVSGYTGPYKVGTNTFSKNEMAVMTRDDDPEFTDFVNWIIRALFAAEQQGITKDTAEEFMTTPVFGEKYQNMFIDAIAAIGNYGEFYNKFFQKGVPRNSNTANMLNNGSTGMIYYMPFGENINSIGPDPEVGSTIHQIMERGMLKCGLIEPSDSLPLDANYCYALTASLFGVNTTQIEIVNVTSPEEGFIALDSGDVDVLAGVGLSLEADVLEPATGKGFTFSLPYFYHPSDTHGPTCLVTREDDPQWSDFVYWTVSATFFAEDEGITQRRSSEMPPVNLFGMALQDMTRHAIGAVGNYDEMYYNKNISGGGKALPPRGGRNLLNTNPLGPQHFPGVFHHGHF